MTRISEEVRVLVVSFVIKKVYMSLLLCIVLISLVLIFWQVMALHVGLKWKLLALVPFFSGIMYLPLGLTYKIGVFLPYAIVFFLSALAAVSILFISLGVLRMLALVAVLPFSLFLRSAQVLGKTIFTSHKVSFVSLVLAICIGGYSFFEAIKNPTVRYYDIAYENLPTALHNYRIAHISDTHSGILFREQWHVDVVEKVMREKVHLIVHTGDIADGPPERVKDSIKPLLNLSAPDGVYYVMGNHENYHSAHAWREYFKENSLNLLEDASVSHKTLPLTIAGAAAGPRTTPTDYNKLLQNVAADNFILLLDHYPNRATRSKEHVDLQLSGHTHGGLTFYLAPFMAKFNEGFVNGLYPLGEMNLFVTSCAGLWNYAPFRLLVPSEIAILRLVAK